jgi:hypothetical protein
MILLHRSTDHSHPAAADRSAASEAGVVHDFSPGAAVPSDKIEVMRPHLGGRPRLAVQG